MKKTNTRQKKNTVSNVGEQQGRSITHHVTHLHKTTHIAHTSHLCFIPHHPHRARLRFAATYPVTQNVVLRTRSFVRRTILSITPYEGSEADPCGVWHIRIPTPYPSPRTPLQPTSPHIYHGYISRNSSFYIS